MLYKEVLATVYYTGCCSGSQASKQASNSPCVTVGTAPTEAQADQRVPRSQTSGLRAGTLGGTLPGAWCYRFSDRTVWPGAIVVWLGDIACLICSFCVDVVAGKSEQTRP